MPNLLLCMTPGVGLSTWDKIGSLQRELKPYEEYLRRGWNVKILTFDKDLIPELPDGIEAVRFPDRTLLWLLPWTHKEVGVWADVIKTNQSVHAFFYTRAAKHWKKPILLRCGYVHGEFLETTMKPGLKIRLYQLMEKNAFRTSTHCEVPTEYLSRWVYDKYGVSNKNLSIVPNFVDMDLFMPAAKIVKKEHSVVSVGRLNPLKRYDLLIKACAEIPRCQLTIIGEGPEKGRLEQLAQKSGLKLTLTGNIDNRLLSQKIQEHTVFAIVSSWEGHPKALMEAMASGMPCLGVEAPGISGTLNHRKTGILVEPSLAAIVNGLKELFSSPELRSNLSSEARKYVEDNFSFDACFSREYGIAEQLLA